MLNLHERITTGGGKELDILILGVDPSYKQIRRMRVVTGRFFDDQDSELFNKVCLVTQKFAELHYGGSELALGQEDQDHGGALRHHWHVSREHGDVWPLGDPGRHHPDSVHGGAPPHRHEGDQPDLLHACTTATACPPARSEILRVIKSRHRPESEYKVDNLTDVLQVAEKTANAFTMILLLFAVVTLIVGGVGIMNIMLATVSARIREIGIRKAVGATRIEIELQFLTEAVLISLVGGIIGTLLGLAIPFSLRLFTDFYLPIPFLAALIAIVVSCSVGIVFGMLPAKLAAKLDPIESLRHE